MITVYIVLIGHPVKTSDYNYYYDYGNSSDSFLQMCNDIGIDTHHLNFIVTKLFTIIIRTTYYIFCMRNKP